MKKIVNYLTVGLLAVSVFGWNAFAEEGVLEIADDHKVFYRHHPAEPGEPTFVLLNGLVYDLSNWDAFYEELKNRGFGVLQTAYSTQPESLRELEVSPYFAESRMTLQGPRQAGIEIQTLVDETMAVVDSLGIDTFHVLSLSYGSIPGSVLASQQIDRVKNLFLNAPAMQSAHRYNPYGASRHALYASLPDLYDYYYDAELYSTMYPLIAAQGAPSGVSFIDFFHGVYQMARSTKWFDLKDMAEANLPQTHLFLASREDPPLYRDQIRFWELMEANPAKGKLVLFEGAPHALPGVVPAKVADQLESILTGQKEDAESVVPVGGDGESVSSQGSDDLYHSFMMPIQESTTNCTKVLASGSK